ncbi:sensor histidine kinase [Acetivibrio mesophilus]|uniref:Sensor histidine kinase n=1 Tax=Acetivibrio mesophilus TaxID=2487273 RepID=A0A4Q0I2E2_9FIRM|nr:sensor histidine kinase [Acetivibrio mesophilus]RXE58414.1 sensor histidine kinase [Acetivibrio mesophilus]HHV28639.1 sensor histidine kinase [Clostridium sp.]
MRRNYNAEVKQIKSDHRIFTTKKKIIFYFFIAALIIFFIFNWMFYRMYSENIEQILITESKNGLSKTMEYVDMIIKNMEYTADVVQNNLQIQNKLENGDQDKPNDYFVDKDIVDTLKSIVTYSSNSAASIDLYLYISKKLYTSDYGVYSEQPREVTDYYRELVDKKFFLTDGYRKKLGFLPDRNYEQITMIRPMYVLSTGAKSGVLAVNFDKYYIKNIIRSKSEYNNMILDSSNNTMISTFIDKNVFVQEQIENLKSYFEGESGEKLCWIDGEKYVLVYDTSKYSGWKYVTLVPASSSMQQMTELRNSIFILFLIMNVVTAATLILLLSKTVYRKLNRLIVSMRQLEKGNFNIHIRHKDTDEFGFIYSRFNDMVEKIRYLFGELYTQKLLQKDAELKLLQSKINPHFIYNIFDNMNWLIQLERYEELEILVDSVSTYFKRSLNAGKDFISVADTLQQLESYVKIQKIRFKDRFECTFDFDDEIIEMMIPNFMLQPLLENAICHGVEPKTGESLIQVKGIRIRNKVFFTIEDDGAGINSDTLKKISDFLANDKVDEDNYFALANINRRIKLYYGEEYGLSIRSTESVGTKVTVIIPFNFNKPLEGKLC